MTKIIGRESEIKALKACMTSNEAELLAIYGRRRVGKTFLVREYFSEHADLYVEFTGQKDTPRTTQLHNFRQKMIDALGLDARTPPFKSWNEAFQSLAQILATLADNNNKKVVVFLDELPWMATKRSDLLSALDYNWNTRFSLIPNLTLVICGSAASWIIDHIVNAKGGLHNRITKRLRLLPFTLKETRVYFEAHKFRYNLKAVIEAYMAVGGIPFYLKQFRPKLSPAQNIDEMCFSHNGLLVDEFDRLFQALFGESEIYETIIRALAKNRGGISRTQLIDALGSSSGGTLNKRLKELEESGFITRLTPYNKSSKDSLIRIIDPYLYFYMKWIEPAPKTVLESIEPNYWVTKYQSKHYSSWAGYAYENLCLSHPIAIKNALGLQGIHAEYGNWFFSPKKGSRQKQGAQIDLLFDRTDNTITLCEIKFNQEAFSVSKRYAAELKTKLDVFEQVSRTKKNVQIALITLNGFKPNTWSEGLIDHVIEAKDIF